MPKPHPHALRTRVVDLVRDGNTPAKAASMLRVSESFVRIMCSLSKHDASLSPSKVCGHRQRSLTPEQEARTRGLAAEQPGLTVDQAFTEFRMKWPKKSSSSPVYHCLREAGYKFKLRNRGASGKSPNEVEDEPAAPPTPRPTGETTANRTVRRRDPSGDPDKEGFSGMKWALRDLVFGGAAAGAVTTPKDDSNTPSPATESVNPIESNGEEDGQRGKVNWHKYELALVLRGATLAYLFDNTAVPT